MPLRVSLVPPDLEMTTRRVWPKFVADFGQNLVHAVGIGVVEEINGQFVGRGWPRAWATNCGPSAEPPMPMTSRFLNGPLRAADQPGMDFAGKCLDGRQGVLDFLADGRGGGQGGLRSQ